MTIAGEQKAGACWECGYSLRGLPLPRCPECGRGFDPADEATMNMGRKDQRLVRWLMGPPGWPTHVLTAAAALMSIWAAATPVSQGQLAVISGSLLIGDGWEWTELGHDMLQPGSVKGRYLIGLLIWLIVAAIWISRRSARGITVRRISNQKAATFAYWRRWLVTPLVVGATLIVCWTRMPVVAGFWLSKASLDKVIKDVRAMPPTPGLMRGGYDYTNWLGIYPPRESSRRWIAHHLRDYRGETWIFLQENGAFVYRDDGQPPSSESKPLRSKFERANIQHLYGPWYSVDWQAGF